jgi:hypothetical protein
MLAFLMPADERRSFMLPPESLLQGENLPGAYGSVRGRDRQTTENSSAPARSSLGATGRSGVEDRTGASLGEPIGPPSRPAAARGRCPPPTARRPRRVVAPCPSLAKEGVKPEAADGRPRATSCDLVSSEPTTSMLKNPPICSGFTSPLPDSNRRPPPYHGGFALREGDRATALVCRFSLLLPYFRCQPHPSLEQP